MVNKNVIANANAVFEKVSETEFYVHKNRFGSQSMVVDVDYVNKTFEEVSNVVVL